jgi:hypothetical protein
MYFKNKLKTRVYKPSEKTIEVLPLEELGLLFKSLLKESKEEFNTKRQLIRQRLELEYARKHNATHEAPYEGDFEFLDAAVTAEIGKFSTLGSEQTKEFNESVFSMAKQFNFSKKAHEWVFPQMQAFLVENLKLPNTEVISCSDVYNIAWNNPKLLAIVEIFKISARGLLLGNMTTEACREYSKLVPLVFAAYKKYAGMSYSRWSREDCWKLIEDGLADAMTTQIDGNEFTVEDILTARDDALLIKSGDNAGSRRSPVSTYMLYPSGDSLLYGINTLLQHILCQTWCAHPSNRSKYAILDTMNWDNQNIVPLVSTDVLKPLNKIEIDDSNPWD